MSSFDAKGSTNSAKYEFWRRWLVGASIVFILQSAGWAIFGALDPFGFYDRHAATSLFGTEELPPAAQKLQTFILGPFGATTAGFFVLVYFLARYPLAQREPWSLRAIIAGVLTWFFLDTGLCLFRSAFFNIWIVNLPCMAILGPPLWFLSRHLRSPK